MGRSVTPKYVLHMSFASGYRATLVWDGRATAARLAAWVDRFNASMLDGGANAHLGPDSVASARVALNFPGGPVVATWSP